MAKPYDYMVARMLLAMANKSEGLEFTNVEHASGEVGWNKCRLIRVPDVCNFDGSQQAAT